MCMCVYNARRAHTHWQVATLARTMLVSSYTSLQKQGASGNKTFQTFTAARAIGLAVEVGHVKAQEAGLGCLTAADVRSVQVTGTLRIEEWDRRGNYHARKAKACTLQLQACDAQLAKALVEKQRSLLGDLNFNIGGPAGGVQVRSPYGHKLVYDLLGDFNGPKNYGVANKIWVEIKVYTAYLFESELGKTKTYLAELLPSVVQRDPSIGGVMILAARIEKQGASWGQPLHTAILLQNGAANWKDLVCLKKKAARGQCKGEKPAIAQVFQGMEWWACQDTKPKKVGLLKHFLAAFKLDNNTAMEDRARVFNQKLQEGGHGDAEIFQFNGLRAGKPPWVATKDTFRAIYNSYI